MTMSLFYIRKYSHFNHISGLKNKCNSNMQMFNVTNMTETVTNYVQQLNSTIVDPSNIPDINRQNLKDNVDLSPANGVVMDI